jgi:hypothetical protein
MKRSNIKIQIEQVAKLVTEAVNAETDEKASCDLADAIEYLRRAYWAVDGGACEDNQTGREMDTAMKAAKGE